MGKPLFSVIVPLYCGSQYVEGIIENLNAQNIDKDDWELILVDDASPDDSVNSIKSIIASYANVRLLENEVNRRQGGARNHAVKKAKGEWVVYLDQDDRFYADAFANLKRSINGKGDCDIFAVDMQNDYNGKLSEPFHYKANEIGMVSGLEYLKRCEVSWAPWNFIYKLEFLRSNKIEFVEHVRFEDVDYIMLALSKAKKVEYLPLTMVIHSVWDGQTSEVGNDFARINDLFKISCRVADVALQTAKVDKAAGVVIMNHHYFMHTKDTQRYLWRLKYKEQKEILKLNKPRCINGKLPLLLKMEKAMPTVVAMLLTLARPVLTAVVKVRKRHL